MCMYVSVFVCVCMGVCIQLEQVVAEKKTNKWTKIKTTDTLKKISKQCLWRLVAETQG